MADDTLGAEVAAPPAELPRKRPRVRARLRSVLIVVSLFILLLPFLGVYALRLHEVTLLGQTEEELVVLATLLSASYRTIFAKISPQADGDATQDADQSAFGPRLTFSTNAISPPLPAAVRGPPPDELASRIGADLATLLRSGQHTTHADMRVVDSGGVVVATTGDDLGLSLTAVQEVREALGGQPASRLRRVADIRGLDIQPIVRGAATKVHVAMPVLVAGQVVGAVLVSRQPSTIVDTLVEKRILLLQGAALFLVVGVGIAVITARTLVLPIQRLRRGATRVSRGETERFERGRHYRVRELAELADSIETMVLNLQQRTNYLRDFVRHMNHEFKTPIAAARGALELLTEYAEDMTTEQARRFLSNLSSDVARLDRLAQRLLELAQADLASASEELTDMLAVARAVPNEEVRVADGEALARIPESSARAVLTHLADNAAEHGATEVKVSAQRRGPELDICVTDNGRGIAPADCEHAFDPFYTTRADRGGTGLGLAICRALVENAGGRIALTSAESGTTFTITLDAAD